MKKLASYEAAVGGDGGKVSGVVGVEQRELKVQIEASYPLEKMISPATKAVDSLLDKLEKAIPGNWDKPMIENFKKEYQEELVKLLAE